MQYEFEGRTEEEAIEIAAQELGLERDEFDVEIMESQRGGFLRKGKTKIKVYVRDSAKVTKPKPRAQILPSDTDFESNLLDFVQSIVEKMGYTCHVSVLFREEQKIGIKLDSDSAAILIGKKGKNLDALQLLSNVYAGKLGKPWLRVILDTENYRIRREESLVKMAYEVAEKVRDTRQSVLLEALNPFERRIIHTTLNDIMDIETKSEGEGLYKRVRVIYRGQSRVNT